MQVGEGRPSRNSAYDNCSTLHQVDRQIGAQISGEAGDQIAHEGVVQQMDGAHLGFRDTVRAAEIELYRGGFFLAALQVLKCGVDFLLR